MKLVLGVLLSLICLSSGALSAKTLIACKQTSQVGLYEQCEEVRLMKNLGERSRVYFLSQKKLVSWENSKIFELKNLSAKDSIEKNELVVVPGKLFWSATSSFHQTLCKANKSLQNENILNLNCGKPEAQNVNRNLVFKLVNIPSSTQFSSSYQSKK